MRADMERLKGVPLTDLERLCMGYKAQGLYNRQISRLTRVGPRVVSDNLLRARHKLGGLTLEHAIALFTEAHVLRGVIKGIDGLESPEHLSVWRQHLGKVAENIDARPVLLCVHGLHITAEACEDCYYTKPGTHDFQPLEFMCPLSGRPRILCTRCRRWKSAHGRVGEKKRKKETK